MVVDMCLTLVVVAQSVNQHVTAKVVAADVATAEFVTLCADSRRSSKIRDPDIY